jgi:hypothetical protein
MSLQQLSYLAEIIGVVAVVVSVLYLAKQVKVGNDLSRTDTFRSIMQGLGNYCNDMFGPQNERLIEKGFRDFSALSSYEKIRFENFFAHYFNYVEDSFHSSNVELLGEETMENWVYWLQTRFFAYKGVRDWWQVGKRAYAPDFQAWIDSVIESTDTDEDVYGLSKST